MPQVETLRNYFQAKAPYVITAQISVLNYLPNMTVESFFAGILKMFNLTCYPIASDIYQIEPLTDWYDKGAVVDITQIHGYRKHKCRQSKVIRKHRI